MIDGHAVGTLRRQGEAEEAGPNERLSDRQLLERFVRWRDQCAFAALVQRHGPLVLSVCRRVLQNEHDAEDAFQAVFLVLARKAGVIRWRESLRPWLQAAAYRLALHARAAERRRGREKPLASFASESAALDAGLPECLHPWEDPLREVAQRELRRVLAEEVHQLPDKYRDPVVLCYLQGKSNEEAARELGWPTGSMSRRLARARDLLRERLLRRGLTLSLAFVVLAALALWLLRGGFHPANPGRDTAAATRSFQAAPHDAGGMETILLRLTERGGLTAGTERGQLARLARQTADAAERLERQTPGRNPHEWQRSAADMRGAALSLADSLDNRDDPSTVLAARRLHASCQKCHALFRE